MISSVRSVLQQQAWVRVALFVAIFAVGTLRHQALTSMGYVDTGLMRWLYSGAAGALLVVFTLFSTPEPLSLGVDRPRAVGVAYTTLFLILSASIMAAIWAHASITSPVFLICGPLFALLCGLEMLARRRRAGRT